MPSKSAHDERNRHLAEVTRTDAVSALEKVFSFDLQRPAHLWVKRTKETGKRPPTNLRSLNVSSNQLSGTLPIALSRLPRLASLDISRNVLRFDGSTLTTTSQLECTICLGLPPT